MNKDYITRDSGVKCITSIGNMVGSLYDRIGEIRRLLQDLEPSDVVSRDCYDKLLAENDRLREERPVTHGYWKRERNGYMVDVGYSPMLMLKRIECKKCGATLPNVALTLDDALDFWNSLNERGNRYILQRIGEEDVREVEAT